MNPPCRSVGRSVGQRTRMNDGGCVSMTTERPVFNSGRRPHHRSPAFVSRRHAVAHRPGGGILPACHTLIHGGRRRRRRRRLLTRPRDRFVPRGGGAAAASILAHFRSGRGINFQPLPVRCRRRCVAPSGGTRR